MRTRWMLSGATVGLILLTGCDQSFEPLARNDSIFSMSAVLNASADTQWVRVMPIRESVFSEPMPIDAKVTLEHRETGHVIELRDSLFGYAGSDPDVVATLYVHNFWTTEPLVRGGTYIVRATRGDGQFVSATVRVPLSVRRVVVSIHPNPQFTRDQLRVESDGHVALLQVLHGLDAAFIQRQPLSPLGRTEVGVSQVSVNRITNTDPGYQPPLPARPNICAQGRFCTISMVISGDAWPFKETLSEAYVIQNDAISNVEGGTGFVGAVLVHEVPYEACSLNPRTTASCALVYDETTATVVGTVTDTTCNVPLPGAWVVLRRADGSRIRPTRTRSDGSFRIGAVEAGIPHVIFVDELTQHESREQAVPLLTGGEIATVSVGVERLGECPEA